MRTISPQIARRLAISAQRLTGPRPRPNADGMLELFRDLRCVQIDPIRAVERTELLVLWSRLGKFDPAVLEQLLWQDKTLFEYWAHCASIVLTEDYPIFRHQMARHADIRRGHCPCPGRPRRHGRGKAEGTRRQPCRGI